MNSRSTSKQTQKTSKRSEAQRAEAKSQNSKSNAQAIERQHALDAAMGQAIQLMMRSPAHKHMFISDMEWLALPPIMLAQMRIFRRDDKPFAVATWAFVNEEIEQRLLSGQFRLSPNDWNSGDRPWLVDLIAPFGGGDEIINVLSTQVFKGKTFKAMRPAPDGKGMQAVDIQAEAAE